MFIILLQYYAIYTIINDKAVQLFFFEVLSFASFSVVTSTKIFLCLKMLEFQFAVLIPVPKFAITGSVFRASHNRTG